MTDDDLRDLVALLSPEQLAQVVDDLPEPVVSTLLGWTGPAEETWRTPADLARAVNPRFVVHPHTAYLSDALAQATRDAAGGEARQLVVSMPPREGKSTMSSIWWPLWLLAQRPFAPRTMSLGLISSSPALATYWARTVRRAVEESDGRFGQVRPDTRAAADWQTMADDLVRARSVGQNIIGQGFQAAVLDDIVKDAIAAHSSEARKAVWSWWTGTMAHRMEPGGSVTAVVGTRWHEDDFIGRLLSGDHEGDPDEWEEIVFPALAVRPSVIDLAPAPSADGEEVDDGWRDVLGRRAGEPLLSPLVPDETVEQALARWEASRRTVGSYVWAAVFQQDPSPAGGLMFAGDGLRYWSRDPELVAREPGTSLLPDERVLAAGVWVDSWDTAQTEGEGDWTVGQRWVKVGQRRYLVAQVRGQWSYNGVLRRVREWSTSDQSYGAHVRRRLIEKASSGVAVAETLSQPPDSLSITAVKALVSKEDRAMSVTPEWEAGQIVLPHPDEPGYAWSREVASEILTFPSAAHDDMVDAMTQAMRWFSSARRATVGGAASPGAAGTRIERGARGGSPLRGGTVGSSARRSGGPFR